MPISSRRLQQQSALFVASKVNTGEVLSNDGMGKQHNTRRDVSLIPLCCSCLSDSAIVDFMDRKKQEESVVKDPPLAEPLQNH